MVFKSAFMISIVTSFEPQKLVHDYAAMILRTFFVLPCHSPALISIVFVFHVLIRVLDFGES